MASSDRVMGECINADYIKLFSRGGLLEPSVALSDAVRKTFAILDSSKLLLKLLTADTRGGRIYSGYVLDNRRIKMR